MCSPFIGDTNIFVNDSEGHSILNAWARTGVDYLSVSTAVPGSRCLDAAKAMVCHSLYPYCDPTAGSVTRSPRPICKRTCEAIINGTCRGVLDALPDSLRRRILSSCDTEEKEGGDMPECIYISLETRQNLGELVQPFCVLRHTVSVDRL